MEPTEKRVASTEEVSVIRTTETCQQCPGIARREFLCAGAVVGLSAAAVGSQGRSRAFALDPEKAEVPNMRFGETELVVQPVLTYRIPQRPPRGEWRSWRSWGSVQTKEAVDKEAARINGELKQLCGVAGFGVRMLPVAKVSSKGQAVALKNVKADVVLVYAAGGGASILNTLSALAKWPIIFVRYRPGPNYNWQAGLLHTSFLRNRTDHIQHPHVSVNDVVVDDNAEILWRLRALYGLKNILGRRIVCIGGPGGWPDGPVGSIETAPELARERFQLDMVTVPTSEMGSMIEAGRKNDVLMAQCKQQAKKYLHAGHVTLRVPEKSVTEAFLLKKLLEDLMAKFEASAVTIHRCMKSIVGIMPCLTLGMINDTGRMAYCESDFDVIPSGILMHYISGKPTYLCNPAYPHSKDGMMFAHCSAARRMDGKTLEPVDIVTHYESDLGAATHVQYRKGQLLTIIQPDFEAKCWLMMTGKIVDSPSFNACRAQVEVKLNANRQDVVENLRGHHCMLAYGDYTKEVVYAANKVGIMVEILEG